MNLPNKLTLARVLLIPVFILFLELSGLPLNYLYAVVIFSLASITDFLDGHLARKNNMVTDFGKFADPLADKLLTITAMIYMTATNLCHPIALTIIIAREFAVSGVRMIAASSGGKVIAANIWGKIKTVLQIFVIIFVYLLMAGVQSGILNIGVYPQGALSSLASENLLTVSGISNILMWIVALVTLLSGVQYLWQNRSYINTAK